MYSFHLIPIYNRAQFVDKTDPCRSMSRRRGRVRTGAAMECHQDIAPETPSLASAGAMHACLYLLWECSAIYAARQVLSRSVNLLPWFVRSRAGLRAIQHRADEGHCPCLQWCCAAFRWARKDRYIHPATRECATDVAGGLPMLWICHTAAKAPHRLCASSPGSIWGFPGAIGIGKEIRF